ncbi:MAG: transglutaminase domain-containing protein [Labilithrix sp.]|nr:transglutaminase domain-containing protein [Labilithrix sp.]
MLVLPLVVLALTPPAIAQRPFAGPRLHEPIPPDPREDVALSLSLDGDLPAAINTPRGLVSAPDPARPFGTGEAPYSPVPKSDAPGSTFHPDRNTTRPDTLPYDDPFSPSTAPFKRLAAYDSVDANYTLSVRDAHTTPLAVSPVPPPDASEEHFYADMVVDLAAGRKVRIPSVGAGARVLRARAGIQSEDVKFTLYKDGAENWFIEGEATTRARLVMEVSAPRASFGGDFGNPTRAELRAVPALPPNVQAAAAQVAQKIGVTPRSAPREVVTKLVAYFRAFQDSEEPPTGRGDIYLDLALQQKGVCRHRSFAFLVTALYLGIPTRMISNEAHAWVEVDDGRTWRRIDLGGAGRMFSDPLSQNLPYEPPPDPFAWPQGSTRGDDLADRARRAGGPTPPAPPPLPNGASSAGQAPRPAGASSAGGASGSDEGPGGMSSGGGGASGGTSTGLRPVVMPGPDDRPPSSVTMTLGGTDARRGAPLAVRGQVAADGEACGHVAVEIVLRSRSQGDIPVGVLATDERGNYAGALVLPASVPLGDYEAHARTLGDGRCGRGQTR